jgi:hypothetical protein
MKGQFVSKPWPHYVTENCLDLNSFNLLKLSLESIFTSIDDGNHVFDLHDLSKMGLEKNALDIIVEHSDYIIKSNLFKNFSEYRSSKYGYFVIPKIGVSKNKRYGIHDDTGGNYKSLSYLVYISPLSSTGTILCEGDKEHSILSWEPNKGIYFCPVENVTYHDFLSNNEIRITLNINISALEMLYDNNHLEDMVKSDKEKVLYCYNLFKQNKLYVTNTNFIEFIEKHL